MYFIPLKKAIGLSNCKTRKDNKFYMALNGIYHAKTTSISINYFSFTGNSEKLFNSCFLFAGLNRENLPKPEFCLQLIAELKCTLN